MDWIRAVARQTKTSPETIREGLRQGRFPFGAAVKGEKRWSYIPYPSKLKDLFGIELEEK